MLFLFLFVQYLMKNSLPQVEMLPALLVWIASNASFSFFWQTAPAMGTKYLKNHMGMKLTDAEYEEIPHPHAELVLHVIIKNFQAFSVLSTFVFGPIAAVSRKSTRNLQGLMAMTTKASKVGLVLSPFTGTAMTYGRVKNDQVERVYDRDFRLRHNKNQVRVDQASIIGGLGGAAIGMSKAANPVLGYTLGVTTGVLGAAFYNNVLKK